MNVLHIEVISGDRNFEFCEFLIRSNIRLNIEVNSWSICLLKTPFSLEVKVSNDCGKHDCLLPSTTVGDKTCYQIEHLVRNEATNHCNCSIYLHNFYPHCW